MSSTHEGGHGSPSSGRPIGFTIAAVLSTIVLGSLLAVVLLTGKGDESKANERPKREKVVKENVNTKDDGTESQGEQEQAQQQDQGQQMPVDPYGTQYPQCDPYLDPLCPGAGVDTFDQLDDWPLNQGEWPYGYDDGSGYDEFDPYSYDESDPYSYDEFESYGDEYTRLTVA